MVKDHKSCGKGKDKTGKARLKVLGAGKEGERDRVEARIASLRR